MTSLEDRAAGALVGLAVGDALGATLEFSERDTFPLHTELTGGGPFNVPRGAWTDDASMALCLAESLVAKGGLNPGDVMDRLCAWWLKGENSVTGHCFDIGLTTRDALARFRANGQPFAGVPDPDTAGNGSLVRVAPVAIFRQGWSRAAVIEASEQSRLTHAAAECVEACELLAHYMTRALIGCGGDLSLEPLEWLGESRIARIASGEWRGKARGAIRSSGYVVHTLEAALWAVAQAESFEGAVIAAVNLGDDSDSVGAVAGQLAGAIWGLSGIPDRWLGPLAWRERIEVLALKLLQVGADAQNSRDRG